MRDILLVLAAAVVLLGCDDGTAEAREYPSVKLASSSSGISSSGRASLERVAIRVLLLEAQQAQISSQKSGCVLWDASRNRQLLSLGAGQSYWLRRNNGFWQLKDSRGRNIWPKGVTTASDLEFRPGPGGYLSVGSGKVGSYRGNLRCLSRTPGSFAVVNVVDIEDYLAGVVGSEMPSSWHKSALRAQAIAARTYALYFMNCGEQKSWDVRSTQASQVYKGLSGENKRISEVVNDTRGLVLAYGQGGKEKLFPTYYSSICGGHTQDATAVFQHSLAPLEGRACPYCVANAPRERFYWPSVKISKKETSDLLIGRFSDLKPLAEIVDLKIASKSSYGRIEKMELTGKNGFRRWIRGEDVRLALSGGGKKLLSGWYELKDGGGAWLFENGRGWGHGVGMCQYGCQQMAALGNDCIDILQYYYPQSVLLRAY